MKITFWGGAGTVTGSKYLVQSNGKRILVDCGMFQGLKELRLKNWGELPFDPSLIDAVILTHAHIDHSGYLPVLVKLGYRGPVYCTPGTRDLCRILLPDSGRLQEEEAEYANRKGFSKHHPALPLYTEREAEESLKLLEARGWEGSHKIGDEVSFRFLRAGHILGAASVLVEGKNCSILFSGDLGRESDPVLRAPETPPAADYLVVESTYGGRLHPNIDLLSELAKWVCKAIDRGGVVVVPAFAVGRTQTLLYCLHVLKQEGRIPDVPVYLNSPMSQSATRLFCEYLGEHRLNRKQCHGTCEVAKYVRTAEDSKALNKRSGPMIILSASGMATGGRVLHHLKAFGPDERNLILLTGFQAAGTRGASLMEGKRELKIHGQLVPIRAEVFNIDAFSAHADQGEILKWLAASHARPKQVFITHGEPGASLALKAAIEKELRWNCLVPKLGESADLQ